MIIYYYKKYVTNDWLAASHTSTSVNTFVVKPIFISYNALG